jgi:hypothetical protein
VLNQAPCHGGGSGDTDTDYFKNIASLTPYPLSVLFTYWTCFSIKLNERKEINLISDIREYFIKNTSFKKGDP